MDGYGLSAFFRAWKSKSLKPTAGRIYWLTKSHARLLVETKNDMRSNQKISKIGWLLSVISASYLDCRISSGKISLTSAETIRNSQVDASMKIHTKVPTLLTEISVVHPWNPLRSWWLHEASPKTDRKCSGVIPWKWSTNGGWPLHRSRFTGGHRHLWKPRADMVKMVTWYCQEERKQTM